MPRYRILVILFFTLSLSLTPSFGAGRWPDGTPLQRKSIARVEGITIESIIYSSDGLRVRGILFSPPGSGRLPCIVFCHDGIRGISREHRLASTRLAKAGYVVFSPSYRGEDGSEGVVEIAKGEVRDVLNALTMVSHLEHVDGERLALVGASHGATIDLIAASRTRKIRALVLAYGVADLYQWWAYLREKNRLGSDGITTQTYGKGPKDRPLSFALRNGISFVSSIPCPVLIVQGEMDDIVPKEQALLLEKALIEGGIPYRLNIYPHCAHGFLVYVPYLKDPTIDKRERQQTEKAWSDMLEFLRGALKSQK